MFFAAKAERPPFTSNGRRAGYFSPMEIHDNPVGEINSNVHHPEWRYMKTVSNRSPFPSASAVFPLACPFSFSFAVPRHSFIQIAVASFRQLHEKNSPTSPAPLSNFRNFYLSIGFRRKILFRASFLSSFFPQSTTLFRRTIISFCGQGLRRF